MGAAWAAVGVGGGNSCKPPNREFVEFNYVPSGLFMDGHFEFIKYPGEWPITTILAAISGGTIG